MGAEDDPTISILDATGLNDEWVTYLEAVGCTPDVGISSSGTGTRALSCTFAKPSSFQKLSFRTASVSASVVDNSIRVPLDPASAASLELSIDDILTTFGLLKNAGEEIPQDGGSYRSAVPAEKQTSLFRNIITALRDEASHNSAVGFSMSPDHDSRNAIWMTPGQRLRFDTALTLKPNKFPDAISKAIKDFGVPVDAIQGMDIIAQKTTYGLPMVQINSRPNAKLVRRWEISSKYTITFKISVKPYIFWISFKPNGMTFTVTQDPTVSTPGTLFSLMGGSSHDADPGDQSNIFTKVVPLRLVAGKEAQGKLFWRATIAMKWSKADIYLDYDSSAGIFAGGLILGDFYKNDSILLSANYDPGNDLIAPKGFERTQYVDIRNLSTELSTLPYVLPTAIAFARVSYAKPTKRIQMSATLFSPSPPVDKSVPQPFTWSQVDVDVAFGDSNFGCSMASRFELQSPATLETANFALSLGYSKTLGWVANGSVENINGSMLADFFDEKYKRAMMDVLGKFKIPSVRAAYTYAKGPLPGGGPGVETGGDATSFILVGKVELGELTLRLMYQYASSKATVVAASTQDLDGKAMLPTSTSTKPLLVKNNPKGKAQTDWTFECDFDFEASNGKVATVYSVIDSIVYDVADFLPPFVQGIVIPSVKSASPISIKVKKSAGGEVLFALRVIIGAFSFTFAQITKIDPESGIPATKKILRFSVDKIPYVDKIPLIGGLVQPFDELEYVWVNDAGEPQLKGLLDAEVNEMNANVLADGGSLYYQRLSGPSANKPPSQTAAEVVIRPGHHFMVIRDKNAILDHVFGSSKAAKPTLVLTSPTLRADSNATPSPPPLAPTSPPAKGALESKQGPLTISSLALQVKETEGNQSIHVTMDAKFAMGPMTFSLLGFGFSIPLKDLKLDDLAGLIGKMNPEIRGLSLAFDKPPLLIAGGFEHRITETGEHIYLGGIGIGFVPYTFVGVGEYAIMNGYKSVFLYAKLDGKLVTLAFATISGVRLGFGFNSSVRSPAIEEIFDFPFINDKSATGAGNDPIAIVKKMVDPPGSWVTPKQDAYWLAAGMTVQAFDILTVTAVVMVAFKDSNIILSVFADAVAQMPPDVPDRSMCMVYVEIGMIAEVNLGEGYFRVEAALAPTSFLLVPQCHLYGGFALVYWFGPNAHAGDWVFSVGGYHPKYERPAWYPAPRRLGISFNISDCFRITGEAYFAVTPKCVMGGAMIHASLSVGIVRAWLDAAFDCLINFHPLHYRTDFHVAVGVECDIDILFIHVHISVSVGAWLTIQGPEFGGSAHVDFYLFAFDVNFGATPSPGPALNLQQFWEMLHTPGPSVDSKTKPDPARLQSKLAYDAQYDKKDESGHVAARTLMLEGAGLKFALEDGNFTNPPASRPAPDPSAPAQDPQSTGAGVKWYVKGGSLRFRIASDFAISSISVTASSDTAGDGIQLKSPVDTEKDNQVYSRPMRVSTPMSSDLQVSVTSNSTSKIIGGWTKPTLDIKPVPVATFGKYTVETDPSISDASSLLNQTNATIALAMGLVLCSPPPHLALSPIPVFKASNADKLEVRDFRYVIPLASLTEESSDKDKEDAKQGMAWWVPRYDGPVSDSAKSKGIMLAPLQDKYTPTELSDEVISKSNKERWNNFGDTWQNLAQKYSERVNGKEGGQEGLLALCASALGWERNELSGNFPSKTVKRINASGKTFRHLEETYLSLPQVAVS